jgi:hypothetical protein
VSQISLTSIKYVYDTMTMGQTIARQKLRDFLTEAERVFKLSDGKVHVGVGENTKIRLFS